MKKLFVLLFILCSFCLFAGSFNVKDFGAVGDGKTDDTAAIRKAVASAIKASRDAYAPKTVYFPSGRYIVNGEIKVLGKARGSKQANNLLQSEIEKAGGVDFDMPVMLGYTGLSDALLKKYIEDSKALWENSRSELNSTVIGSVIGTHAGPGAVAVAFFAK